MTVEPPPIPCRVCGRPINRAGGCLAHYATRQASAQPSSKILAEEAIDARVDCTRHAVNWFERAQQLEAQLAGLDRSAAALVQDADREMGMPIDDVLAVRHGGRIVGVQVWLNTDRSRDEVVQAITAGLRAGRTGAGDMSVFESFENDGDDAALAFWKAVLAARAEG